MTCDGIYCVIGSDDKCEDCGNQWEEIPSDFVPYYVAPHLNLNGRIWRREVPSGAIYRCE